MSAAPRRRAALADRKARDFLRTADPVLLSSSRSISTTQASVFTVWSLPQTRVRLSIRRGSRISSKEESFSRSAGLSRKRSRSTTIETIVLDRPGQPFLGAGEVVQGPVTAALANAIYDATGVRVRDLPFTAAQLRRAALES